jgi:hypothetical protein
MSALPSRRLAWVGVATAGLLFFAGMLVSGSGGASSDGVAVIGPVGSAVMALLATSCAARAAWAARGGQRRAWLAMAIGLGGWTAGAGLWCYIALGGIAPISTSSAAEIGYVVLPFCGLAAALLVPTRDDSRFGIGLIIDGVIVATSLFVVLGSLVLGRMDVVGLPRDRRDGTYRRSESRVGP